MKLPARRIGRLRRFGEDGVETPGAVCGVANTPAMNRTFNGRAVIVCVVLAFLVALIGFFPLGGYRVLPTKYENCFTHDTPCGRLSGEQR